MVSTSKEVSRKQQVRTGLDAGTCRVTVGRRG